MLFQKLAESQIENRKKTSLLHKAKRGKMAVIVRCALCASLGCGWLPLAQAGYIYTTVSIPGAMRSQATGINDSGGIVGNYSNSQGASSGFLDQNGSITTINVPGAADTYANGISNTGTIVGQYLVASTQGSQYFGFLDQNGTITTLSSIGSNQVFSINGISSSGTYIGTVQQPDIWFINQGGGIGFGQGPAGSTGIYPRGINNSDISVGNYYTASGGTHGYTFTNGIGSRSLNVPGATITVPRGINNIDTIVGTYINSANINSGFLDVNGVFSNITAPGSNLTTPTGINNSGVIVGYYDTGSAQFGFLATPVAAVPEPSTWLLFGTGMVLVYMRLRKQRLLTASRLGSHLA